MRTQKFIYNSTGALLLQIITTGVGFILPRIMLSYFGSEINGLVTSLTQLISYFTLVEAGIASSVVFSLYKPLAENDNGKISSIVSAAKRYYNKTGLFFLLLVFCLAFIYPQLVKSTELSKMGIFFLTLIIGMNGTLDFFIMAKYRALLTADQKVYVISIASAISTLLNTVLIILFSYLRFSIVFVRFFSVFSIFIRSIILFFYTKTKYPKIKFDAIPDNSALSKRKDAFYLQLLGVVQSGTPVLLATMFVPLKMVSVYSIYTLIVSGLRLALSVFESGLPATFGEIIAKNELTTLQKTTNEFQCFYYMLISTIYATAMVMIIPFIQLYTSGVKDVNYMDTTLGILFILDAFLYNLKTPQGMLVISAGLFKETKKQTTIQGLIIVIVGLILTPIFGLNGIVIASISANAYRTIDLLFFIPKFVTKNNIHFTLKKQILSFIPLVLSIFVVLKYSLSFCHNFQSWVLTSFIVLIITFLLVLALNFIFDRQVFLQLVKRIKWMIKNKGKIK